jgi:hypothetical protein
MKGTGDKARSRGVARVLEEAASRAMRLPASEIPSVLDQAEAAALQIAATDREGLEVRRRVAEWKVRLLCDCDAPYATVERAHGDLLKLGYSTLEAEGHLEIQFARYCARQQQKVVARKVLTRLHSRLVTAIDSNDLEVYRNLRDGAQKILAELDP